MNINIIFLMIILNLKVDCQLINQVSKHCF